MSMKTKETDMYRTTQYHFCTAFQTTIGFKRQSKSISRRGWKERALEEIHWLISQQRLTDGWQKVSQLGMTDFAAPCNEQQNSTVLMLKWQPVSHNSFGAEKKLNKTCFFLSICSYCMNVTIALLFECFCNHRLHPGNNVTCPVFFL